MANTIIGYNTEDVRRLLIPGLIIGKKGAMVIKSSLVRQSDAEFIFSLRTNSTLSEFLSPVKGGICEQNKWITEYLEREQHGIEYYFVISIGEKKIGTIRIYNISDYSCTYGSWVFMKHDVIQAPILAECFTLELCYSLLGIENVFFDVRLENKKVLTYHKIKKLRVLKRDDMNEYYVLSKSDWDQSKKRIRNVLGIELKLSVVGERLTVSSFW